MLLHARPGCVQRQFVVRRPRPRPRTSRLARASPAGLDDTAWLTLWTVGHSTRTIAELLALLAAHRVEVVADVRRHAGSRRLPQFGQEALAASLGEHGVGYVPIPALGGRRRPGGDSPNGGWRHPSFRGYADHMATEEFADGLFELLVIGSGLRTAIMCAEVLWWRCHRRLIADALVALGVHVVHVRDEADGETHVIGPPAHLTTRGLSYAATPAGDASSMAEAIRLRP